MSRPDMNWPTKIKRVLISILLALSITVLLLGVLYAFIVYTNYAIIISFIAILIGIFAKMIYNALFEY